ncbi:hypothetical protein SDC9_121308 [bioreactor metagenome]|uniref:Uncharacterized protein n=1 Tax=bioreactor metagenome TaxID=1076179 RepID=A0A645CBL7_9ZZZZ
MYVLLPGVEEKHAAVVVDVCQVNAVLKEEVHDDFLAQNAQVPCDNQVIIARLTAGVGKVGGQRVVSGRGHGGAHVGRVADALVHNFTHGGMGDVRPLTLPGYDNRPSCGGCPLRGGCALGAIFQRRAVLPLGRAEMGGGEGRRPFAKAAVQHHGGQRQGLGHGAARAVKPEKGHVLRPGRISRANALIQKIPGKQIVQHRGGLLCLVQGGDERLLLHSGFRFFPAGLTEGVVAGDIIKKGRQRAFALFFAHHVGKAGQ